jgi:hypothetical protein
MSDDFTVSADGEIIRVGSAVYVNTTIYGERGWLVTHVQGISRGAGGRPFLDVGLSYSVYPTDVRVDLYAPGIH